MSKVVTLKVGTHRGKNLIEAGFLPGKLYRTTTFYTPIDINQTSMIVLQLVKDDYNGRTRKVSNKKGIHPIIDMNSKAISTFFGDSETCNVTFANPVIFIRKG